MDHMGIGVPYFIPSFGKVHFLSPAMSWPCFKCSDTGMHHMRVGVHCFLLSFGKVHFLYPVFYVHNSKYVSGTQAYRKKVLGQVFFLRTT